MERPLQCPFIERVDHRCSSYFSLERLDHAFEVCFDQYKACPLFQQMMAERRMKRHDAHVAGHDTERASDNIVPKLWVTHRDSEAAHAASRFVQVRVADRTRTHTRTAPLTAIADAYTQLAP
jgi:hypothetical protein